MTGGEVSSGVLGRPFSFSSLGNFCGDSFSFFSGYFLESDLEFSGDESSPKIVFEGNIKVFSGGFWTLVSKTVDSCAEDIELWKTCSRTFTLEIGPKNTCPNLNDYPPTQRRRWAKEKGFVKGCFEERKKSLWNVLIMRRRKRKSCLEVVSFGIDFQFKCWGRGASG